MKQHNFKSFLVGGVAEKLVEQLFISLDFKVFPFGMENSVPEIKSLLYRKTDRVSARIRNMPDFIIMRDDNVFFLEVKYRSSGKFTFKELEGKYGDYPYPEALVILVSPKHIKAKFASELKENPFKESCNSYLGRVKELEFSKEEKQRIVEFCNYAKHFFEGVNDI